MSCDIHIVLEKKIKSGVAKDVWHICNNYRVSQDADFDEMPSPTIQLKTNDMGFQNYECFGLLAGVRSLNEPFVEPRGLPPDCHMYTRKEYENNRKDYAYHDPSWYGVKELIDFVDKMKPESEQSFSDKSMYNEYIEWFTDLKSNMVSFIKTIVDFIYQYYEYRVHDGTTDDIQYCYRECAEKYRIVFWFDS